MKKTELNKTYHNLIIKQKDKYICINKDTYYLSIDIDFHHRKFILDFNNVSCKLNISNITTYESIINDITIFIDDKSMTIPHVNVYEFRNVIFSIYEYFKNIISFDELKQKLKIFKL